MDNRGLVVDDYTLRKYERNRSWGLSVYERLAGGLSRIEGKEKYLRATTVASTTDVMTDGVS